MSECSVNVEALTAFHHSIQRPSGEPWGIPEHIPGTAGMPVGKRRALGRENMDWMLKPG